MCLEVGHHRSDHSKKLTPTVQIQEEEKKEEETKTTTVRFISSGVKKIIRQPGVEDEHEEGNAHAERDISHISE